MSWLSYDAVMSCSIPAGLSVNLPRSKIDQYREGSFVLIASSGTPTCPVAIYAKAVLHKGGSGAHLRKCFGLWDSENKERGALEKFWPHSLHKSARADPAAA